MLHGSETWRVKLTLHLAEVRMIRWMHGIKVADWFTCSELRERLGIDEEQHTLRWYGHALRKDKN